MQSQSPSSCLLTFHLSCVQKTVLHVLPQSSFVKSLPPAAPRPFCPPTQEEAERKHLPCPLERREEDMVEDAGLLGSTKLALIFLLDMSIINSQGKWVGRRGRSSHFPLPHLFPQPSGPGSKTAHRLQREQLPPCLPLPGRNPRQLQEESEKDLKHIQYSAA